jgi:ABC-type multidrug transport system fused ATPase/permease subunit
LFFLPDFFTKIFAALTEEAPRITHIRPPKEWPTQGKITFQKVGDFKERVDLIFFKVEVKYRPNLPSVLKEASFTIYPKEKIGTTPFCQLSLFL